MTLPEGASLVAAAVVAALAVGLASGLIGYRHGRRRALAASRRRRRHIRRELANANQRASTMTARHEALLAAAHGAVLETDGQLRVIGWNKTATEWFGAIADQPSLMAVTRSLDLVDRVASSHVTSDEGAVRVRGRVMRLRVSPIADGGRSIHLADESQLERLERARRDLVANLSHDLRTPITALGLLGDALSDRTPSDRSSVRAAGQQIQGYVAQLRALADGVVELSRVDDGRALFQLVPIALANLVAAAAESVRPQLHEADIQLMIDVPDTLLVLADEQAVVRAIANLLDNAIRFSPRSGQVTVSAGATDEPDRIMLLVVDQGPGIAPSDRERVFERFYRSDPARSGAGAGLGLAIVRHIVVGHGGTVTVEDNAGGGAALRLTLPRAD